MWADGSKARPPMTRGDGLRVGRDTENTFMSFHVAGSMSFYTARCSVLLILVLSSSLCKAADKKQLSVALAAVDANLKTSAGKQ